MVGSGVAGRGIGAAVGTPGSNVPTVMITKPGGPFHILITFTITTAVLVEATSKVCLGWNRYFLLRQLSHELRFSITSLSFIREAENLCTSK
jgi:hypothetical protein